MLNSVLLYIGAALPAIWGISHLFPTKSVVRGFGDISVDNKNIIAMEWIVEGVAMIFIGLLIAVVTIIDSASPVAVTVYILAVFCLLALAMVSLFTGFKINFLPFKLCPVIFTASALCVLLGGIVLK